MKYPNKIEKKSNSKKINSILSFKNKGDNLEYDLNLANFYYVEHNIALIYKKPTPIKVVDIRNGERTIITKAFFQTPSTTDYNGIYKGKYIDFEAKETASNTSFNLNNVHTHQIEHLVRVNEHGGIAFLIVLFTNLNKAFLMPIENYIDFTKNHTRKSIPISYFEEKAKVISYNFHPRIDYIKVVDELYFGGYENEKEKI